MYPGTATRSVTRDSNEECYPCKHLGVHRDSTDVHRDSTDVHRDSTEVHREGYPGGIYQEKRRVIPRRREVGRVVYP